EEHPPPPEQPTARPRDTRGQLDPVNPPPTTVTETGEVIMPPETATKRKARLQKEGTARAKAESKAQPKAQAQPKANAQPKAKAKAKAKANAKAQPNSHAKAKAQALPIEAQLVKAPPSTYIEPAPA
ncbi:MAG: hypothetical protein ACKPKO_32675, partial [Candidatus Fonsibacter sp.]